MGYFTIKNMGEDSTGKNALSIAKTVALTIDGDNFEKIKANKDVKDAYYLATNQYMNQVLKSTGCTFLYTISAVDDKNLMYVCDGTDSKSEDFSGLGDTETYDSYPEEAIQCLDNGSAGYSPVYDADQWGMLASGFAPIKNSAGKVVGAVGCDYSASAIQSYTGSFQGKLLIIVILLLVVSLSLSFIVLRRLFRLIKKMIAQIKLVGAGDLTIEFDNRATDEIGQINRELANMTNALKAMAGVAVSTSDKLILSSKEMEEATEDSAIAYQEIVGAIGSVVASADEQASDVEAGHQSIIDLVEVMNENKTYMEDLNQSVNQIVCAEREGTDLIEELIQETKEDRELIQLVQQDIMETNESAQKIDAISKTIQDVAGKTTILALNAAIEAQRAGEAGKGFYVVADEVRKLAETSNSSAREIIKLIEDLKQNSLRTVDKMEGVTEAIERQRMSVGSTKEQFSQIVKSTDDVKVVITNLNQANEQLEAFKTNVTQIFEKLHDIAQSNLAATEETTASVQMHADNIVFLETKEKELNQMATALKEQISRFKVD